MGPPSISEPHTQSPSRKEAWIPGLQALEVKGQAELSKEASGASGCSPSETGRSKVGQL